MTKPIDFMERAAQLVMEELRKELSGAFEAGYDAGIDYKNKDIALLDYLEEVTNAD